MVSQSDSVNAQATECDLLLTGGRVGDPETGLNEVADVAISGGTGVRDGSVVTSAMRGRPVVRGAR
jgi:predicted amidohydrolase